jgi:hypothetical protein
MNEARVILILLDVMLEIDNFVYSICVDIEAWEVPAVL